MSNQEKKEIFKILINEFQESPLPDVKERELKAPLNLKKIIAVFGPRRSGKSFYFYGLIKKLLDAGIDKERIVYMNFEDDRLLPLDASGLGGFTEAYFELYPENKKKEIFLFFDEIQNVKNWEIFVRRVYDKENCKIFITGSSSKLLSREIATALRGRTISFALYPLNFREYLSFQGEEIKKNVEYTEARFRIKKMLDEYFEFGGLPEIVLTKNKNIKRKILKEYFDMLVFRDLAERFSLENTGLLRDILKYFFTNITGLFSVNSFYKSIKQNQPVSRETVANYVNFIMETEYFRLLPKFSYSLKEQKVNPKKIIAVDNGLRNRISFRFSSDEGKLAENLIGGLLARKDGEIYYWQGEREVDFVVRGVDNGLEAVNVSYGASIEKREIESLLEFSQKNKKAKLILITRNTEKKEKNIKFIPLWKWLLKN